MRGEGNGAEAGAVVVIDREGAVYELLRACQPETPLRRADPNGRARVPEGGLVILAADGRLDWNLLHELVQRARTLIVSTSPLHEDACRALAIGAIGYVDAYLAPEALRRTILGALAGEAAFSRRVVADYLLRYAAAEHVTKVLSLTPRQREVVTLIATGAADKEIASKLGIATGTAQKHVTNALRRLDVPNRAAAAAIVAAASGAF